MENQKEYYKQTAINAIDSTIREMEETLEALHSLKNAVTNENLADIKEQKSELAEHISMAHGEHLRFSVPCVYDIETELEFGSE